jgi:hypothetical protein
MSIYVVTWNLNKERSNYDAARREFIAHLERMENIADSGLESVRFISTSSTASDVDVYLREKLDKNDRLFVSKVNRGENAGWLAKNVWDWINARI